MEVFKARFGTQRTSLLTHLINLRKKIHETLRPNEATGNLLWLTAAEHMPDHETGLEELVAKFRNSISKIDHKFVGELRGEKGCSIMQETIREIGEKGSRSEVECYGFSSWCNLGFYEADFGWGKSNWVTSVTSNGSVFMNLFILVDTKLRDGIEAWVSLDEEDMSLLEVNSQVLNYATLDPSPLAMNS